MKKKGDKEETTKLDDHTWPRTHQQMPTYSLPDAKTFPLIK